MSQRVTFSNGANIDAWADLHGGVSVLVPAGQSVTVELAETARTIGGLRYPAPPMAAVEAKAHWNLPITQEVVGDGEVREIGG